MFRPLAVKCAFALPRPPFLTPGSPLQVAVIPLRVNANLKCSTVEDLVRRRMVSGAHASTPYANLKCSTVEDLVRRRMVSGARASSDALTPFSPCGASVAGSACLHRQEPQVSRRKLTFIQGTN
jgi:hypothetical protein